MAINRPTKLLIALYTIPPILQFLYLLRHFYLSYDGTCANILDPGPKCTMLEYLISEFTHTFVLTHLIMTTLVWVVFVGLVSGIAILGIKISRKLKSIIKSTG
jgi:hypothetical protein